MTRHWEQQEPLAEDRLANPMVVETPADACAEQEHIHRLQAESQSCAVIGLASRQSSGRGRNGTRHPWARF